MITSLPGYSRARIASIESGCGIGVAVGSGVDIDVDAEVCVGGGATSLVGGEATVCAEGIPQEGIIATTIEDVKRILIEFIAKF